MTNKHPPFSRVLLTNDDGISAPGFKILEGIAREIFEEVWVVAPMQDQSGTSHSISLHQPIRLQDCGRRRFAVQGTPSDCVVMAIRHLMRETPPTLILSGINRGANLGTEIVFSGTVGAAMVGALHGIRSIALSQVFSQRDSVPWSTASYHAASIIRQLAELDWGSCQCMNVNFPECAPDKVLGTKVTRQGIGKMDGFQVFSRKDLRDSDYFWLYYQYSKRIDVDDTETAAISNNYISISPLQSEHTHEDARNHLLEASVF